MAPSFRPGETTLGPMANAVPLVAAVHRVVGRDFAASLIPGRIQSIFPPSFAIAALCSGVARAVLIAPKRARPFTRHRRAGSRDNGRGDRVGGAPPPPNGTPPAGPAAAARHEMIGDDTPFCRVVLACNVAAPHLFWRVCRQRCRAFWRTAAAVHAVPPPTGWEGGGGSSHGGG